MAAVRCAAQPAARQTQPSKSARGVPGGFILHPACTESRLAACSARAAARGRRSGFSPACGDCRRGRSSAASARPPTRPRVIAGCPRTAVSGGPSQSSHRPARTYPAHLSRVARMRSDLRDPGSDGGQSGPVDCCSFVHVPQRACGSPVDARTLPRQIVHAPFWLSERPRPGGERRAITICGDGLGVSGHWAARPGGPRRDVDARLAQVEDRCAACLARTAASRASRCLS